MSLRFQHFERKALILLGVRQQQLGLESVRFVRGFQALQKMMIAINGDQGVPFNGIGPPNCNSGCQPFDMARYAETKPFASICIDDFQKALRQLPADTEGIGRMMVAARLR